MPFYGWLYGQEGHAVYPDGASPYARPLSIEVIEGGEGFDPVRAVEILNVKRLPWELPESDLYRADWLAGGALFPAGRYRITMQNNIRPAQGMPDEGLLEYPWVYTAWVYAVERRAHARAILDEPPFSWYPQSIYQHSATDQTSHVISLFMGHAEVPDDWEPSFDAHGTTLAFNTPSAVRIAAIIARVVWVWRAASIPDFNAYLVENAHVNGFSFRYTPDDEYVLFATDGPH